jgi:hypothetical protein
LGDAPPVEVHRRSSNGCAERATHRPEDVLAMA